MDLTEPIESINQQLVNLFGIDTITSQPMFRVVWSNDQFERRLVDTTDKGIFLLHSEVREVPKYPWIKERYILERLVLVPEFHQTELAGKKLSYEPLWVFKGKDEQYVPPTLWACKFVIDTVFAALGKKGLVKYVDEEARNPVEYKKMRIKEYEEQLFGDESSLQLKTVTGEAVAYTGPTNYWTGKDEK